MAVTRYCPRCGPERREGERFCRNCGQALETGETVQRASPVTTTTPLDAPPGGLPPRPTIDAPAASGRPVVRGLPPFKPLALTGGLALVVSVFLPWISGGVSISAIDIPLEAVWSLDAGDGAVKLGFVVLALGGAGAALAFVARSVGFRRLTGSIALALILGFGLNLFRSIDQSGGSLGDVVGAIGLGIYAALAGAVCLEIST